MINLTFHKYGMDKRFTRSFMNPMLNRQTADLHFHQGIARVLLIDGGAEVLGLVFASIYGAVRDARPDPTI